MLLNFYSRGCGSGPGPALYSHSDLAALTLLLVPSHGGGQLLVREGRKVDFRPRRQPRPPLAGRAARSAPSASVPRRAAGRPRAQPFVAAVLVGRRLPEACPSALPLPPTEHKVVPRERRAAGYRRPPRLSVAFFYCRHRLRPPE
mmetsp:Transcript_74927/g.231696  ORF Transcript_74927/g.231696 Transcript_74927/m.231696 type:complete len:145 (+) Transcript_74927:531-965(+)